MRISIGASPVVLRNETPNFAESLAIPSASSMHVDKSGQRVRGMFAGIARRYDLLNHVLSLNIDRYWRAFTIRQVPPRSSDPILDVCTGTGDLAIGYARRGGSSVPVIGADFCREMLEVADRKVEQEGLPVRLVEADAQRLPFPDDTFQIVCVAFGLRNVADTRRGLAEMIRVARPGGRVAILEFSRPRLPILRWLYLTYFRRLLPWIGQWVSKSEDNAYHYLPASVMEFPDGEEMIGLLSAMGLEEASATRLTLGIASLYVGSKPVSPSS